MKLVRQPKGSNLCGQACVATLAGIDLDTAIEIFGTKGKTTTKQVIKALTKLCMPCGAKRDRGMANVDCAMLHWASNEGNRRHWTILYRGKHYDPASGVWGVPPTYLIGNGRVTSHLKIFTNSV